MLSTTSIQSQLVIKSYTVYKGSSVWRWGCRMTISVVSFLHTSKCRVDMPDAPSRWAQIPRISVTSNLLLPSPNNQRFFICFAFFRLRHDVAFVTATVMLKEMTIELQLRWETYLAKLTSILNVETEPAIWWFTVSGSPNLKIGRLPHPAIGELSN